MSGNLVWNTVFEARECCSLHDHCGDQSRWAGPPNWQLQIGSSSLSSGCLHGTKLQVVVTNTKVVLAGSDEEGDNITVRGTLDATGTRMKSTYILNGSASGRSETDDGVGDLAKR